jgi:hypothetical protein
LQIRSGKKTTRRLSALVAGIAENLRLAFARQENSDICLPSALFSQGVLTR